MVYLATGQTDLCGSKHYRLLIMSSPKTETKKKEKALMLNWIISAKDLGKL